MDGMNEKLIGIFERLWKMQGQEGTFDDFMAEHVRDNEKARVLDNIDRYNKQHGELDKLDGYDCKKCLNKGEIHSAMLYLGSWYEQATRCDCWKVRASIRRMKKSGLENSLHKLKDFKVTAEWQQNMVDTARQYLVADHSNGASFFVGGAVGSGKTFIGTAICRELLHSGHEVIYMPWVNEAQRLKALAADESLTAEVAAYTKAEYLYIDDLFKPLPGQTAPTPADVRLAYDIINYRYINKLPMIISCEKYVHELLEVDEATVSRIYEMAKGFTVNVGREPGRNYRLKDADKVI